MELELLPIDFFGFIFYPPSKRFAGEPETERIQKLTDTPKSKVGVFVNETGEKIIRTGEKTGLSHIQLHGEESPEFCRKIRESGFSIIKAFRIDERFNFDETTAYGESADFFLFDTRAGLPGGTGEKYNWELLKKYQGKIPFFLSGGIRATDVSAIRSLIHPQFYGIDLNSGFEDAPGLKNFNLLKTFIYELQKQGKNDL